MLFRSLALHADTTKLIVLDGVDAIADALVEMARPGDQIVLMSNGSFDGLKDLIQHALPD